MKLLPCPFCGGKKSLIVACKAVISENFDLEDNFFAVCCSARNKGCGATGGYDESEELAIIRWNRRTK